MFVEHITRYNFNPLTEKEALEKYRKALPTWDCETRGAMCVTLTGQEAVYIDMTDGKESGDKK